MRWFDAANAGVKRNVDNTLNARSKNSEHPNSVFFKFLSSQIFLKSRRLWDLINIISSAYLDSWSNESNRQKLAEKPANFAGCRLFYTTLWPIVPQLIVLFGIARYASKQMLMKMRIIICSLILKAMAHWVSCYKGSNSSIAGSQRSLPDPTATFATPHLPFWVPLEGHLFRTIN